MDSLESKSEPELREILRAQFENDYRHRSFAEIFKDFEEAGGKVTSRLWKHKSDAEKRDQLVEFIFTVVSQNKASLISAIRYISDPVLPGEPASFFVPSKRARQSNDVTPRFQDMPEREENERVRFYQTQSEAYRLKLEAMASQKAEAEMRHAEELRAASARGHAGPSRPGDEGIHDSAYDTELGEEALKAYIHRAVRNKHRLMFAKVQKEVKATEAAIRETQCSEPTREDIDRVHAEVQSLVPTPPVPKVDFTRTDRRFTEEEIDEMIWSMTL
jgi:hypothetical protein